jgi:hypothetical protein
MFNRLKYENYANTSGRQAITYPPSDDGEANEEKEDDNDNDNDNEDEDEDEENEEEAADDDKRGLNWYEQRYGESVYDASQ